MRIDLCRPRTILLPIDLSPHSQSAAAIVSLLVDRFASRVVVLYAVEPVDHPFEMFSGGMTETRPRVETARAQISEFIAREFPKFPFELRVEEGKPAPAIVRVAEEVDADLICMPTRGHGPFRKFLLGSVTGKVLNDAHVPLLTGVHLDDPAQRKVLELRTVVCALSLDDRGEHALRAAKLVSQEFSARLIVAHSLEEKTGSGRAQAESTISGMIEGSTTPAEVVVGEGEPARFVSEVAGQSKANLVVIGRSTPGPLGRLRAQSYSIVRESPCPVLSV